MGRYQSLGVAGAGSYQLDPFYLNARRVIALVGPATLESVPRRMPVYPDEKSTRLAELATFARALKKHLDENASSVPSFEVLLAQDKIEVGQLFTTFRDFACSNVSVLRPKGPARVHCRFDDIPSPGRQVRLVLGLHRDHLAPGSPGEWLTGNVSDLHVVAVVHAVREAEVEAIPLFIGRRQTGGGEWGMAARGCELNVGEIDSFAAVRDVQRGTGKAALETLRGIPEVEVKRAFAQIIGEPDVPNDWAGERSDLYTNRILLDGRATTAGFVFKGPGAFRKMTLADLGKNGDQLLRLATEPADLLVVQHCHEIHACVRQLLRALCNQVGSRQRFCVIDGYDTLRVLAAYRKCGLTPSP